MTGRSAVRNRHVGFVLALSAITLAVGTLLAQTQPSPKGTPAGTRAYTAPRTPDGQPDLQGVWSYATITPLERPSELAGKATLTEEEAAAYEKRNAEIQNRDRRDHAGTVDRGSDGRSDLDRAYNHFWWDFGTKVVGNKQTSLIVDPPDGKLPPLTPEGQKRAEAQRGFQTASAREEGPAGRTYDSYEDRPLQERCLSWTTAGPPMMPGAYNNNVQLFQGPGYVAMFNEMIHEHRIIPLDRRPHLAGDVRQWLGDSRGHWEGPTLVIETTNFYGKRSFRGSSDQMRLTERFTRVAPEMLLYEFTVEDPATWTKPWTVRIAMEKSSQPVYEYACHEGNYSLTTVLTGARVLEKTAAEAAKRGSR
jgi:hypothetical protein